MKTRIQRWGNDLALIIPKTVAEAANIQDESDVDIAVVQGGLWVKLTKPRFTLEAVLEGITDENLHAETDTGSVVGREIG